MRMDPLPWRKEPTSPLLRGGLCTATLQKMTVRGGGNGNFPGSAAVKDLPASAKGTRDTGFILGQEDPLEEEAAPHSSILAWRIPMDRGARWATIHGIAKSQTRLITHAYIPLRIHAGEAPHSPASARVTVNTSSDAQTGRTDAG